MDRCRDIFAESHTNDAEPAPALDVSTALLGYVNVGDRPPYARLRWPRNLPVEAALHVELTEHGLRPATVLRRDFSNPDAVCFVAALSDYDCPPQLAAAAALDSSKPSSSLKSRAPTCGRRASPRP